MNTVVLQDERKLRFIVKTLLVESDNPYEIQVNGDQLRTKDIYLLSMIERCVNQQTFVLPVPRDKHILWFVFGENGDALSKHVSEISHFIVPVLAEPYPHGRRKIDPQKGLGAIAADIYPAGYYCFRSPHYLSGEIRSLIELWKQLDSKRPIMDGKEDKLNAYILRSRFQQSVSLKQWEEAELHLSLLKQGHYTTDENIRFLEVQLLAEQYKWLNIWNHVDFDKLAVLTPLPKAVRGAMLTAFYKCVVIQYENQGDINSILIAMKEHLNQLGNLMSFRAGLTGDIFIRLFAYSAVIENKAHKLNNLADETENLEALALIDRLKKIVEPPVNLITTESTLSADAALSYFHEKLYDDAYLSIVETPRSIKRVQVLLGIATMTEDEGISLQALEEYYALSELERDEIKSSPYSKGWLQFILLKFQPPQEQLVKTIPNNWLEWFQLLVSSNLSGEELFHALDGLSEKREYAIWSFQTVKLVADILFELVLIDKLRSSQKQLIQLALPMFTAYVLSEPEFPSPKGRTLYESLALNIQVHGNKNKQNAGSLYKLIEGLLQLDVTIIDSQWTELKSWLQFPPSIKMSIDILEILELFKDYGLSSDKLTAIWDYWCGNLSTQLSTENRHVLTLWFHLGVQIQGDHLLLEYLKELLHVPVIEEPLSMLDSMTITIFSCREKAANRASDTITGRNPSIKVRVCTDDKLTERAKKYARNSHIVIVVTSCTSHSLTTGIGEFMQVEPLYPRSSGEFGIIEVLEQFANKLI